MSEIVTEAQARSFVAALCDQPGNDRASMARLERFAAALLEENRRHNMIARPTEAIIWQRHIADSAQLLTFVPRETVAAPEAGPQAGPQRARAAPWLDLGSGPGLPGLVLAAIRPDMPVILVESRRKRHEWLAQMVAHLGLQNCQVKGCRLESIDSFPAAVITARAFAPLERILALSARFSTSDSWWLLPKGRSAAQELKALPRCLAQGFHVKQSLTDANSGVIVGQLGRAVRARMEGEAK